MPKEPNRFRTIFHVEDDYTIRRRSLQKKMANESSRLTKFKKTIAEGD